MAGQPKRRAAREAAAADRQPRLFSNGVYDPYILKAVFLAGGAGSGKGYTSGGLFTIPRGYPYMMSSVTGLKIVNSDTAFEIFLRRAGIDAGDLATMTPAQFAAVTEGPGSPRGRASRVKKALQASWERGRLGLILDGTGDDYPKIKKERDHLESLGYDTFMVFVNTSLDVAQLRNASRERKLPAALVDSIWHSVQRNIGDFREMFGEDMVVIDNTVYGPPPRKMVQTVNRFLARATVNPIGRRWVRDELDAKRR